MSNVALAIPKSISSAVITGSLLGTAGTSFFIKVQRARINPVAGRIEETTGDGDTAPSFDSSYWQYVDLSLAGWLIAQSVNTLLLAYLWDTTKNPLASSMKLWVATGHVLTIPKALITAMPMEYDRRAAAIPLFMNIKATDTVATWGAS